MQAGGRRSYPGQADGNIDNIYHTKSIRLMGWLFICGFKNEQMLKKRNCAPKIKKRTFFNMFNVDFFTLRL
jgi:hypothetical protein